jgi:putative intracellular protease/amidase/predicted Ser/Thr protein kinase
MAATLEKHPTLEQLSDFLAGKLSERERITVERHVGACTQCCEALAKLPPDTLVERMRHSDTPAVSPRPARLPARSLEIPPELFDHPRYRIIKALGSGGMGVVFQAEHRKMERPVALKVIHRDLLDHPSVIERFELEAKAAGKLSHPNIVAVHDADEAEGVHFLVMEYVEGISLAQVVEKRGPLPVLHVCNYIRQAALGLQHAFEKGMVHRDIKPQNLMLTKNGQVKVLDLGLARLARERDKARKTKLEKSAPASAVGLTEAGSILGTPDYIAPEQIEDSREVDIRADIYGLGCTMYFLLKGQPPFPTGSHYDKLRKHCKETPEPLGGDVPAEISAIVVKMMAKNPADRFQTPGELAQALATLAKTPKPQPEPALARPSRRWLAVTAALGAAVALIAVLVGIWGVYGWFNTDPGKDGGAKLAPANDKLPLLIIVPQEYYARDFEPMRDGILAAGKSFKVASTAKTPCKALDKIAQVTPDLSLLDEPIKGSDFAGVLFPGGYVHQFKDDRPGREIVANLVKEMKEAKKPVAAIDGGIVVLAFVGALKDRKVARHEKIEQKFPGGGQWQPASVVQDDWLLTASSPSDAPQLTRKFLEALTTSTR